MNLLAVVCQLFLSSLFGQTSGTGGSLVAPFEVAPYVEEMEQDAEDDLGLNQGERRLERNVAILFSYGTTRPWQTLAIGLRLTENGRFAHGLAFSAGTARRDGSTQGQSYEVEASSSAFSYDAFWFYSEDLPFFLFGSAGLIFWHGTVEPKSADVTVANSDLQSSFDANGVPLTLGIGLSYIFPSGLVLDYHFVGFATSLLVNRSVARAQSYQDRAVEKELTRTISWGLLNITLGYSF